MLLWRNLVTVATDLSLALKAKLFRGLADPSRLAILEGLRDGEKTVSQLVELTGLSQPNTSAHLSCLKECGLVVGRQDGRFVAYRIADDRLEDVFHAVEEVLASVAEQVYRCTRQDRLEGRDEHRT
jgi:DNA-binding transcriptional ArsR family regulator